VTREFVLRIMSGMERPLIYYEQSCWYGGVSGSVGSLRDGQQKIKQFFGEEAGRSQNLSLRICRRLLGEGHLEL
jgi:hypothetical protein